MNRTRTPAPKPIHVPARHAVGAGNTGLQFDANPEQPDLLSSLWDILSTESGSPLDSFPTIRKEDK